MADVVGEFVCPRCGKQRIEDISKLTIFYPKGIKNPSAQIVCGCGLKIVSSISWEDAMIFDKAGASVVGFSIVRASPITKKEIDEFVKNFDKEVEDFLNECQL